ncbi:MAG: PAS domain S-box protein, partial [Leptospiraceae bacterium]|nr:PAS domain S-box protein [Leptospiraceae bacterium]
MILSDIIKTYLAQGALILAIYGVLAILLEKTNLLSRVYEYITGIVFGFTASMAMLMPVAFHPGFIFDLRGVFLVFAPVFGGLTSAVIATIIAVLTRLIIGGEGSITGLVSILIAVGTGTIYRILLKGKLESIRSHHFLLLGVAVQSLTFGGFLYFLPAHLMELIIFQLGPIIVLANVSLTWLLGFMLQNRVKHYQTTRSLWSTTQRLKTLLHTLPDLVWLKDANGNYAACNKRFENFVGHTEEYILGKTDYDLFKSEIAESFQNHDQLAVESRGPRTNEEEIQFAIDGHREMVETIKTPIFNPDESLIGVLGIARNISDHARIEKQLRTSEQRFRESFEKSGISRALIDLSGRLESVNDTFANWLGYPVHRLIGTEHAEYLHNGDREYFVTFMHRLLNENKESGQLEGRYVGSDGQLKWAIINFILLRDARQTPLRILLDVQDVTNFKRMESNLETLEKRFRLAIENIPDVIVIYDADRRIRYINKATEVLTGKNPADLIGYRDEEIWPPVIYESYLPTLK